MFGKQIQELLELTEQCDLSNVIHSAKLTRCGEAHKQLAHQYFAKAKGEVEKAVKNRNSSGEDGGKHLAAAIGDQLGKPLMSVCRDQDTADGGNTGQMTSNPEDVDAIVKRAWQKIHEGAGGCITSAVDNSINLYCGVISKKKPFEVERISGNMEQASFSRTAESAGALDGWSPKELSLLSMPIYCHIANLLNQIEEGAPWPRTTTHARVVFLEKVGAQIGKVMSYRPLTITSPHLPVLWHNEA